MENLAKWLKNIYPKVVNELNDSSLSSALASSQTFKTSPSAIQILQKVELNELDKIVQEVIIQTNKDNKNLTSIIFRNCSLVHYHGTVQEIPLQFLIALNMTFGVIIKEKLKYSVSQGKL